MSPPAKPSDGCRWNSFPDLQQLLRSIASDFGKGLMLTQANTMTSNHLSIITAMEQSHLQSSFARDRVMNILVYIRRSTATVAKVVQALIAKMT